MISFSCYRFNTKISKISLKCCVVNHLKHIKVNYYEHEKQQIRHLFSM